MDNRVQFQGGPWHNRTERVSQMPSRFRIAVPLPIDNHVKEFLPGHEPEYEIHAYDLECFGVFGGELGNAEWPVYRYVGVDKSP